MDSFQKNVLIPLAFAGMIYLGAMVLIFLTSVVSSAIGSLLQ